VPDQKMDFNTDNRRYEISQVEAGQFISWTEGMLVFRNESIEDVAKRLGRWYNVDIEIKDPELLDYSLWATFIDEPLDEVLKLLALTAPISYEELLRETTGRNLFKKRKMILRLDDKRFNDF
jgi:transmembrane sensor